MLLRQRESTTSLKPCSATHLRLATTPTLQNGAPHRGRGKPRHRHEGGEQGVAVNAVAVNAVAVNAVAGPQGAEGAPAGQAQPSPPADAGIEQAVPPSAFAAAAAAEPAAPPSQGQRGAGGWQPGEGPAVGQMAAPAPSRQATGLTAFYTASEELPPPPGQHQQQQQAQQTGASGGTGGRVQVMRVAADGQPLPPVAEGSSAAGSRPPSSASYSADRSGSEDVEVRRRTPGVGSVCKSVCVQPSFSMVSPVQHGAGVVGLDEQGSVRQVPTAGAWLNNANAWLTSRGGPMPNLIPAGGLGYLCALEGLVSDAGMVTHPCSHYLPAAVAADHGVMQSRPLPTAA